MKNKSIKPKGVTLQRCSFHYYMPRELPFVIAHIYGGRMSLPLQQPVFDKRK